MPSMTNNLDSIETVEIFNDAANTTVSIIAIDSSGNRTTIPHPAAATAALATSTLYVTRHAEFWLLSLHQRTAIYTLPVAGATVEALNGVAADDWVLIQPATIS